MGRLYGLDALRGVAALAVLLYHLQLYTGSMLMFSRGYLAVDFFFMLSGYVMARTYEDRLISGYSARRFIWKRIVRLWPLIALGTLIGFLRRGDVELLVLGLLIVPSLATKFVFPLNGPAWSIFFELVANALHAIGIYRVRKRWLLFTALVAAAACIVIDLIFGSLNVGAKSLDFWGGFPRVIFSYFCGVVLWRTWRDKPSVAVPWQATAIALPVLVTLLHYTGAPDSLFLLFCPLLIAGGLNWAPPRWLVFLGSMSFPLYALHSPVIHLLAKNGFSHYTGAAASLVLAASVALWPRAKRFILSHKLKTA